MERYLRTGVDEPVIGDWATPPPDGGLGQSIEARSVNLQGEALLAARAGYYGLINHVDDQIRRLLSPVSGVQRMTNNNTIVVFTTDHGEMLGDHYRWRKNVPYEPSANIPLLISAPARFGLNAGAVSEDLACLEDVMPTLLDMAGVDIPDTVEGHSLLPAMRGEQSPHREYLHIQHAGIHHCLTDGREKYIWFTTDGREQLFNLVDDPRECHDLSTDPASRNRISYWRNLLIDKLRDRPEGFSDGTQLIAGREFKPLLEK
jgi:arylsulfatase A-like enzyme